MNATPPPNQTILVVEDDALIRMDGADILETGGYRVVEAASADEAIAMLEQAPHIHLLFSDVDMPGSMDGVALAELVHQRWPNIRLLITSGHHHITDAELPDHGRFIAKPYSRDAVLGKVHDLLDEQ